MNILPLILLSFICQLYGAAILCPTSDIANTNQANLLSQNTDINPYNGNDNLNANNFDGAVAPLNMLSEASLSGSIGPCESNLCTENHVCVDSLCYAMNGQGNNDPQISSSLFGISKTESLGSCIAGFCPEGYTCTDNNCYQS
uniref:Hydrophobin n=1 Tax=Rhabditophanes sp. KR3021 TaxID=114890 RepID=A0AC35TYZ5_9BILA